MGALIGKQGSVVVYVGDAEALTAMDRLKNVVNISLPSSEADEVDVTDYDSPGKETEPGDIDYGELQITQHLNVANQYDDMQDRIDSSATVYFQCFIKNKTGEIVIGRKGKGIVKSVTLNDTDRGNAMKVETTIKVSGSCSKVTTEPGGITE